MTNAKLIKGRWVLTGDEVLADAAVAIEGGRIVETGPAAALSRRHAGAEVIGSEHSAVLPGFVNAHHHSHGVSTIQHGCPTVLHLERLGVLSERFSIAHGVWLTESEIAALVRTGAAVSHNPSSNLRLRAGIAPLNALLGSGACVALGMDGTTINEDEDMFSELRLALRLNRVPHYGESVPSTEKLFRIATRAGPASWERRTKSAACAPATAPT